MSERRLAALFVGAGLAGLMASLALTYDKIQSLRDPLYHPACSLNPVISCGSVMSAPQSSVFFGLPNSVFGLLGFMMLLALGLALLSGMRPGRRVWLGAHAAAAAGLVFVAWLMYQSLVQIGALCPWCVLVWCVTVPVFWYLTLYNLERGHVRLPDGAAGVVEVAQRRHGVILGSFYLLLFLLILLRFWYYWRTLF